jgi:hypothetical protein
MGMELNNFNELASVFSSLTPSEIEKILSMILEELGETLLNYVIDEIYDQDLIDTGLMVNSFSRNEDGNVWEWDTDRNVITIEVGSNVPYAKWLNDGYTMNKGHFVPGVWRNGVFTYDPSAKSGFYAKPRSFIGRHYFDFAVDHMKETMSDIITRRLKKELRRRLGL